MIEYAFTLEDGSTHTFKVNPDREDCSRAPDTKHPFWTRLDFNQCRGCPLDATHHYHCPAAIDLKPIMETFQSVVSFANAQITVTADERTYSRHCDVQTGLRSLVGLVMATSGCPTLSRLKGLAKMHLPFATLEETIFRSTGAYLLKQYFIFKEGGTPDLELKGLHAFYEELQTVNRCFKRRIDAASEKDANMNALGSLIYLSMGVSFSLEEKLLEMRPLTGS
jgi:hypothetical protein